MKKSLLLLFSLLIFVGNVWGACTKSPNNVTISKGAWTWEDRSEDRTCSFNVKQVKFTTSTQSGKWATDVAFKIQEQVNGAWTQVWSSSEKTTHTVTLSGLNKKIRFVYHGNYEGYFRSITFYGNEGPIISIPDVNCGFFTTTGTREVTLPITYEAIPSNDIMCTQIPSTDNFSLLDGTSKVSVNSLVVGGTCGDGVKNLTVKFTADAIGEYSDVVKFKYGDTEIPVRLYGYIQPTIAAPTSFTVKEPSYTSVKAEWTYSGSATGFRIVNDVTGAYQYVDGGNVRSCVITGLMPGETYTFTIYPTINRAPSTMSRQSGSITTTPINCAAEDKGSKKIDAVTHLWDLTGGFNWDDKYTDAITTEKNQAIITFDYTTTTSAATGALFFVEESDGTSWSKNTSWSSNEKSGKGCVVLSRGIFKFRFVYSGNFGATISKVKVSTTPYIEVSTDALDFGSVEVGSSATRTVNVSWCAIPGAVSSNDSEFVPNVSNVGENSCGYGNSTVTVTYTADAVGAVSRTLNIGGNEIALTATGVLPAPSKLDAVPSYNYVDLSWPAVTGANSYYLTINDGTSDRYISGITTTSYKVEGLLTSHNYSFSVRAVKGTVQSNPVNATATTKTINVPQNVTCTPDYLSATLNWTEVADRNVYDYYVIYDKDGNQVGTSETSSFQISGLQWGVNYGDYTVKVHAFNTTSLPSTGCNVTTKTLLAPTISSTSISYKNAIVNWATATAATSYKVFMNGVEVADVNTLSYQFTGLNMNETYSFKIESVLNGKPTNSAETNEFTTLNLAVPTITASNIGYDRATLSWSVIDDAADYELYDERTGQSYIFAKGTNSVAIDTLSLHTSYTYRIYSRLADETRSLTYGTVTFSTLDLAASISFELSNISYNAMDAAWDAVEGATGYMIRERWTKMVLTFGSDVTSTTIYGLKPGTYYEFYLYATYNDVQATDSNRISATGTTLSINCPVQVVDDHTFGCSSISSCGFDWSEKVYEITTDKNAPVLSFAFKINKYATKSAEEMTQYGPHIRVEEYTGGQWVEKWRFTRSEGSYSGSANVDNLERSTRKVRIIYKGNLDCSVTDCTISQSSYFELDKSSVPFGECYIGTPSVTQTVSADYSSQAASVVSTDTDLFTVSKETLGNGDCGYGTDGVIITANTALEPGTYNADLSVGRNTLLPMSITILELPAPTPFEVSGTAPASITLTWGDVNITETGYKVVCKQGETEIETKNLGGDVTTCTFEGLTPNVEYTFTITTMYNTIENGSATITGSTANVPAPQNFEISNIMSARADASWSTVTGATGYRLSWDNGGSEGNGSVDLDADVTNYTLTGLIPGTTYTATVTSLFGGTTYGSVDTEFTTTFVVRTSASGDEPANQQHNIEFISGELAGDGSYKAGAVIRYTTSTTSANIRFVSVNVDGTIYNTPEVEIEINSNVHIESYYVYNGIAEVVDEHGEVIYGTLTDAVNAAEEGAVINLLGDVAQDMVVSKYIKFNGNGHDIDNLYINKDGNVELTGAVTVVKDFGLEVSAARSGQFLENGGQIEVTGKAYVDKTFDASGTSKATTWYSLAVPFPVSVANGMFILANNTEKAAHAFSDINIYHYDGAVRAQTISGRPSDDAWVPVTNGYLQPGVFYLVALPKGGANTFRFYKAEGEDLITLSKNVDLYEYHAQNPIHGGWNGIGNSQLYHVGVTFNSTGYAQILDTNNKFVTVDLGESSFAVTTPMFIQSAEDATATFSFKNSGKLRSASAGSATYNLRIAREGANEFADQMFVSASSEATGSYTIGKDLAKFEVSTAYPQIYTSAYNVSLSVHEAAYNEKNIADMPLYIYVPEAGNYTLSLGKDVLDGTSLYLVKDGVEIHNFNTDGAYTLYLAKGKNTSYSLRIAGSEIEDVPTPATETVVDGAIKVYVKEHTLYIEGLAEGETYTVGNMIRSLYSGKSNGNIVRLPLDQQGVYWVKAGEKGVKVLNK